MDEVIFKFLEEICDKYNYYIAGLNGTKKAKPCDFKRWDLADVIGDNYWLFQDDASFFEDLELFDGAVDTLKRLQDDGFTIYIATNAMGNPKIATGKLISIKENLPFIDVNNVFITGKKWEIKGDLLFDDCPEYLNNFEGFTVCNDREYNKDVQCSYRIYDNNWDEFYELCHKIRNNESLKMGVR